MDSLFYFPDEHLICWIAGYYPRYATEQIHSLQEKLNLFVEATKVNPYLVLTGVVSDSRRYKGNQYFYAKIEPEELPSGVLTCDGWVMTDWLCR